MTKKRLEDRFCSFCGKPREMVGDLINGRNDVSICYECVEVCNQILKVEKKSYKTPKTAHRPYPLKRLLTPSRSRPNSTSTSSARSAPRRRSRSRSTAITSAS